MSEKKCECATCKSIADVAAIPQLQEHEQPINQTQLPAMPINRHVMPAYIPPATATPLNVKVTSQPLTIIRPPTVVRNNTIAVPHGPAPMKVEPIAKIESGSKVSAAAPIPKKADQ